MGTLYVNKLSSSSGPDLEVEVTLSSSMGATFGGPVIASNNMLVSGTFTVNGSTIQFGKADSDAVTATAQFTASEGIKLGDRFDGGDQIMYNLGSMYVRDESIIHTKTINSASSNSLTVKGLLSSSNIQAKNNIIATGSVI